MPELGFTSYYGRFAKRLWRDAAPWARDNIVWGIALLVIPPIAGLILHRMSSVDWDFIRLTLYLYGITFFVYMIVYVIRTPWKLAASTQVEIDSLEGENKLADAEISRLKTNPEGPELILEYVDRPVVRGQFRLRNAAGGTARNVYLCEMKTKTFVSSQSENIPYMGIEDQKDLDLYIYVFDLIKIGRVNVDQFVAEALDGPIRAVVCHEDANGKKFTTNFEIVFDSLRYQPIIRQISREVVTSNA